MIGDDDSFFEMQSRMSILICLLLDKIDMAIYGSKTRENMILKFFQENKYIRTGDYPQSKLIVSIYGQKMCDKKKCIFFKRRNNIND